jgi:DNA-binding NtrC family response regulator
LVVEDDAVIKHLLIETLENMGFKAHGIDCIKEMQDYLRNHDPALILLDGCMPHGGAISLLPTLTEQSAVVILTVYGSVKNAVTAIKAGATDYLLKPINFDELEIVIKRIMRTKELCDDYQYCKSQMLKKQSKTMLGKSESFRNMQQMIYAVAATDVSVLIQGESGVGKELIAAELHNHSLRHKYNLVIVDCCTLQEKLFESELFGHEKGAFTGANKQKKGLIEGAENGTLFLDEIGEMELSLQAKLLRILETGTFRRVGGVKDLTANVRIVAATNRNLEKWVGEGKFRRDLYYRLSAFVIHTPSLRERREDIPLLVDHFIKNHNFAPYIEKKITTTAMKHLIAYDWPGNIREMKNVIERSIILSGNKKEIRPEHLAFCSINNLGFSLTFNQEPTLAEIECVYLEILKKKFSGHRAKIAKTLGVSERNTYRLLKKYN